MPKTSIMELVSARSSFLESFNVARGFVCPLDLVLFFCFALSRNRDAVKEALTSYLNPATLIETAEVFTALFAITQTIRYIQGLCQESTSTDGFSLKPLFFPCRTSHRRMFPKIHSFAYSYLLVGIPVQWSGSVGGMLSVDQTCSISWFQRCFSLQPWSSWYSVDADDYHIRGHVTGGLDEKLRDYLTSQGIDHSQFAHAYLLTAAKFLGYSFNPISIWYLYSSRKELKALVLEVNNTFNERHSYFLKPSHSVSDNRTARYTSTWAKDFYVSPFNSRDGNYSISTNDPFFPNMTGAGEINMTITLSTSSKPMLIARLNSTTAPLDPLSMSVYEKTRFIAAWWWVGLATFFPRTVKEAFNLQFRRGMKFLSRPEPRKNTMSRHADETERCIEYHFRRYLRDLVCTIEEAITVRYISAGLSGIDAKEEVMLSPSAQLGGKLKEVEIKILTPLFYSRVVQYPDLRRGMYEESLTSPTIHVSDPEFFYELFESFPGSEDHAMDNDLDSFSFALLSTCKRRPNPIPSIEGSECIPKFPRGILEFDQGSSLDKYVIKQGTKRERREYLWRVFKLLVARKVAFGWMEILDLQILGLRVLVGWLLIKILSIVMVAFH